MVVHILQTHETRLSNKYGHGRGDSWTINDIALHDEGIYYLSQARDRMGLKTTHVFK